MKIIFHLEDSLLIYVGKGLTKPSVIYAFHNYYTTIYIHLIDLMYKVRILNWNISCFQNPFIKLGKYGVLIYYEESNYNQSRHNISDVSLLKNDKTLSLNLNHGYVKASV